MKTIKIFNRELTFGKIVDLPRSSSLLLSGGNLENFSMTRDNRKRISAEECMGYYYKSPLVFSGINLFADSCIGNFYKLTGAKERARAMCWNATMLPSFKPVLSDAIRHTISTGDGFAEILWTDSNVGGYKIIDPTSIEPIYDDYGKILHYKQKIGMDEPSTIPTDEILHFRLWRIGDSMRGIGLVEPLIPTLEIEFDILDSIRTAIKRFATPPLRVTLHGDPTDPVEPDEIKALEEKYKNFDRNKFFGSSDRVDISFMNLFKAFPDLTFQMDRITNIICAGLRVPKPILLAAGETTNRATLEALVNFNRCEIAMIQEKIARTIEEQLYTQICRKNGFEVFPDIVWNPIASQDDTQLAINKLRIAKAMTSLVKSGIISTEEAREIVMEEFKR